MKSAARTGDPVKHECSGGTILGGSHNVEICGLPASRAKADSIDCEDHGPRRIASGSLTVTINGLYAVREDDVTRERARVQATQHSVKIGGASVPAVECMCPTPSEDHIVSNRSRRELRQNREQLCQMLREMPEGAMAVIGSIADEHAFEGVISLDAGKDILMNMAADVVQLKDTLFGDDAATPLFDRWVAKDAPAPTAAQAAAPNYQAEDDGFYASAGIASMKVTTGVQLFHDNPGRFTEGAFEGVTPDSDPRTIQLAVIKHLNEPKGAIEFAQAYVEQGIAAFEDADIDLSMYSPKDREGIYMTYYKQGPEFIQKWLDAGGIPMAGEGCALCENYDELLGVLADAGCGAAAEMLAEKAYLEM